MSATIITLTIALGAIAVGIELRRGNKKAAIRNVVIAAVLLILCALSLATKRPETSQPHADEMSRIYIAPAYIDEKPQTYADDAPIPETLNGGGQKSDVPLDRPEPPVSIPEVVPPANPKDPTAGADVGKNIDPAPDTDTNNGIGVATSMH